jgi:hypothetical protein
MERAIAEHGGQGDRREMELQEALAVSLMFIKGNKSAVVELTGLRTPCGLIDRFQRGLKCKMVRSQMGLPKFRCGVLGIVVVGGKISAPAQRAGGVLGMLSSLEVKVLYPT